MSLTFTTEDGVTVTLPRDVALKFGTIVNLLEGCPDAQDRSIPLLRVSNKNIPVIVQMLGVITDIDGLLKSCPLSEEDRCKFLSFHISNAELLCTFSHTDRHMLLSFCEQFKSRHEKTLSKYSDYMQMVFAFLMDNPDAMRMSNKMSDEERDLMLDTLYELKPQIETLLAKYPERHLVKISTSFQNNLQSASNFLEKCYMENQVAELNLQKAIQLFMHSLDVPLVDFDVEDCLQLKQAVDFLDVFPSEYCKDINISTVTEWRQSALLLNKSPKVVRKLLHKEHLIPLLINPDEATLDEMQQIEWQQRVLFGKKFRKEWLIEALFERKDDHELLFPWVLQGMKDEKANKPIVLRWALAKLPDPDGDENYFDYGPDMIRFPGADEAVPYDETRDGPNLGIPPEKPKDACAPENACAPMEAD